jgi:type IV pilus assembly protein PilW
MGTTIMTVKSSSGFTLIELMVALVISSILMGGVLTIMSNSKKTYTLQSELSVLQDNARFLIDDLTYQIRMAGYAGCSSTTGGSTNPFSQSQNGVDSGNNFPPSSDTLVIFNYGELLPLASQPPLSNPIQLASGFVLPANGINEIWIADCSAKPQKYEVSQPIEPTNPINLNLTGTLSSKGFFLSNFRSGIEVFNGQNEVIYQVLNNSKLGLYRCQDNNPNGACDNPEQLDMPFIEGVESMQVRYGIETNNQIQFSPMTNQNDRVVAIRINLLMRTPNHRGNLKASNQSFDLDPDYGQYNPFNHLQEEGYRHRLFTTTIAVRNS